MPGAVLSQLSPGCSFTSNIQTWERSSPSNSKSFKGCFVGIKQTQSAVFTGGKPVRDHVLVAALTTPAGWLGHLHGRDGIWGMVKPTYPLSSLAPPPPLPKADLDLDYSITYSVMTGRLWWDNDCLWWSLHHGSFTVCCVSSYSWPKCRMSIVNDDKRQS